MEEKQSEAADTVSTEQPPAASTEEHLGSDLDDDEGDQPDNEHEITNIVLCQYDRVL